jgi:hypothetical protein
VIFRGGWAGSSSSSLFSSRLSSGAGSVERVNQLTPVGGRPMHVDHLHGGKLFLRGVPWVPAHGSAAQTPTASPTRLACGSSRRVPLAMSLIARSSRTAASVSCRCGHSAQSGSSVTTSTRTFVSTRINLRLHLVSVSSTRQFSCQVWRCRIVGRICSRALRDDFTGINARPPPAQNRYRSRLRPRVTASGLSRAL